ELCQEAIRRLILSIGKEIVLGLAASKEHHSILRRKIFFLPGPTQGKISRRMKRKNLSSIFGCFGETLHSMIKMRKSSSTVCASLNMRNKQESISERKEK